MAIKSTTAVKPVKEKAPIVFGKGLWDKGIKSEHVSVSMTLHEEGALDQVASLIADVLDEVRFEYRMSAIENGFIKPGELATPFYFKAKTLVEWIKLYYDKYQAKDTPDCFFAGTEDPKINSLFRHYYLTGAFKSPISVGKIIYKRAEMCRIVLAGVSGNSKQWLLNPNPELLQSTYGEGETDSSTGDDHE